MQCIYIIVNLIRVCVFLQATPACNKAAAVVELAIAIQYINEKVQRLQVKTIVFTGTGSLCIHHQCGSVSG